MKKYIFDYIADQEPDGNSEWYFAKDVDKEIERLTGVNKARQALTKAQGKSIERLRKEKDWLIKEVSYGSFQKKDEICERMYQALKEK